MWTSTSAFALDDVHIPTSDCIQICAMLMLTNCVHTGPEIQSKLLAQIVMDHIWSGSQWIVETDNIDRRKFHYSFTHWSLMTQTLIKIFVQFYSRIRMAQTSIKYWKRMRLPWLYVQCHITMVVLLSLKTTCRFERLTTNDKWLYSNYHNCTNVNSHIKVHINPCGIAIYD